MHSRPGQHLEDATDASAAPSSAMPGGLINDDDAGDTPPLARIRCWECYRGATGAHICPHRAAALVDNPVLGEPSPDEEREEADIDESVSSSIGDVSSIGDMSSLGDGVQQAWVNVASQTANVGWPHLPRLNARPTALAAAQPAPHVAAQPGTQAQVPGRRVTLVAVQPIALTAVQPVPAATAQPVAPAAAQPAAARPAAARPAQPVAPAAAQPVAPAAAQPVTPAAAQPVAAQPVAAQPAAAQPVAAQPVAAQPAAAQPAQPAAAQPAAAQAQAQAPQLTRAAADAVLANQNIIAHYDEDDPSYTGHWYVVTRGRTVGVFRDQYPASTSTLGFSGQNWTRKRPYEKAVQVFYRCAVGGGVTDQPAV